MQTPFRSYLQDMLALVSLSSISDLPLYYLKWKKCVVKKSELKLSGCVHRNKEDALYRSVGHGSWILYLVSCIDFDIIYYLLA